MAPRPPHQRDPDRSGSGMAVAGIGAALLMIVCCAAPALIAAGAVAGIGAWISSPWVIAAAVLLAAAAVTVIVRRRTRGDSCCPPESVPTDPADQDRPVTPDSKDARTTDDAPAGASGERGSPA
ncbi:hypothetical protein J7F01_32945 [Streptomyces sp. ISL-22]|uniref:hypothetical protein n=1 Tax=unclassified Streptomyces TaxID=2593676 RepID=UPI001BE56451|nr:MULTISPECIES: hypothetical protein [unclassified Streptomyces]MBT2419383.1 hypothetical protein [Streptomyces sp. ISL-24]MBT2436879.1 hypothetical protein [Streptomyces sp. ISL-22]